MTFLGALVVCVLSAMDDVEAATKTAYSNCTELHFDHPHGVGRAGAADRVRGKTAPVTTFRRDTPLYNSLKSGLDRDNDGVACEAR